jgi:hypothetical protein
MTLRESVLRILELAERCSLEDDIPHELKEAVRYCVARGWVWIRFVSWVGWHDARWAKSEGLFWDRPVVLFPATEEERVARGRRRLLLKEAGEAALAKLRLTGGGQVTHRKPLSPPERNELWLVWYERDGLRPARIRDQWNQLYPKQRIGSGGSGRALVTKGLQRARRARKSRKSG